MGNEPVVSRPCSVIETPVRWASRCRSAFCGYVLSFFFYYPSSNMFCPSWRNFRCLFFFMMVKYPVLNLINYSRLGSSYLFPCLASVANVLYSLVPGGSGGHSCTRRVSPNMLHLELPFRYLILRAIYPVHPTGLFFLSCENLDK